MCRLQAIWSISHNINDICESIIQTGFYVDMLKNLTWDTLSVEILNNSQSEEKMLFVEAHICTLHNVVSRTETARSDFRQCEAVDVMQKFRDVDNPVSTSLSPPGRICNRRRLFVCLLATLRKNFVTDLHEIFRKRMAMGY